MNTPAIQTFTRACTRFCVTLGCVLFAWAAAADDLALTSSRAVYGDADGDRRLVIGSLTNAPRYNFGQIRPLSLYMLSQVRDLGIDAVEVVTTDSHDKMIELLRSGRVDWVAATPYAALMYERDADVELMLTKKSRGRGAYRTVFFARKDAGITSLEDLKGKTIAFEKPGSTSAYFMPAMELLGAGYKLVKLDSPRATAPDDAIGYLFSGDEVNSSTWVHKRITHAAAFSNEDWESDWRTPPAFRKDIAIFHETSEVPRSIELLRSGLDPLLRSRIRQTLLALNDNPDAEDMLRGYYAASDFAEITSQQLVALDKIRQTLTVFEDSMSQSDTTVAEVEKR